jgi:hypothetical protein
LSELPVELGNFEIKKGVVTFTVRNEFSVKMTLISDDFALPWRLLDIKFLMKNDQMMTQETGVSNNRNPVHEYQINYIRDILTQRLNQNDRPLVDVYNSLHFLAQSLQLELLFQQINIINRNRFYEICEYINWKQLSIRYWLDYSKNQFNYKLTIHIRENSNYLQSTHSPMLNWREHAQIDSTFKDDSFSIEKILFKTIKLRSRHRLEQIQNLLFNNANNNYKIGSFCHSNLIESKPALAITFFNETKSIQQLLWISIDYYSGLFKVYIPNLLPKHLKTSLEQCLNTNLNINSCYSLLSTIRMWLLVERSRMLIANHGFKCIESDFVNIVSYGTDEIEQFYNNRIDKTYSIFVEIKNQEKLLFLLITVNKSDRNQLEISTPTNVNQLMVNYYILNLEKCKFNGELDPTKAYQKIMSINDLNGNSSYLTPCYTSNITTMYHKTKQMNSNDKCINEILNKVELINERLPFFKLISVLNEQNVVTQSLNIENGNNNDIGLLSLNIISNPIININPQRLITSNLWDHLVSCELRQKNFKEYFVTSTPLYNKAANQVNNQTKLTFSIEFTFKKGIVNLVPTLKSRRFVTFTSEVNSNSHIYSSIVEAKSFSELFENIKLELISMSKIYKLFIEVKEEIESSTTTTEIRFQINDFNFKRLTLIYGPKLAYTLTLQWSKELKQYEILLGTDNVHCARSHVQTPLINYHQLFINEIKKMFTRTQSVLKLIEVLNFTCLSSFALSKLNNLPKFSIPPLNVATGD